MGTIATAAASPFSLSRASEDTTDHDLVAGVRAGDERAFERLYERYHRRIASYVYGMVKDYGRAEDITQDVFMSALRRMQETDRPIAFKPWLYEIAKNACIDQFRRSRRAEEVSYDAEDGLATADYGRLVTTGPAPDVAVDQKMSLDHLRGAFGGLSQTHHEILVMRELEGLSYREIGDRLGMSRPSVESTLFRARRRLSEEYEELVTGERCLRIQAIIGTAAGGALGTRDQRRMARHVSYCQTCRRQARLAGIDTAVLVQPSVASKIAAFLPLPAFLRRRWGPADPPADGVPGAVSSHLTTIAQWSASVGTGVDPSVTGWARAAAAAATIAVAGVGATVATRELTAGGSGQHPAPVVRRAHAPRVTSAAPATVGPLVGGTHRSGGGSSGGGSTGGSSTGGNSKGDSRAPARGTTPPSLPSGPSLGDTAHGLGIPSAGGGSGPNAPAGGPAVPDPAGALQQLSTPPADLPPIAPPVLFGIPLTPPSTDTIAGTVQDQVSQVVGTVQGAATTLAGSVGDVVSGG